MTIPDNADIQTRAYLCRLAHPNKSI